MQKFLIRNDDIAFDTSFDEIKQFCEICDKYEHRILHAIIPIGEAKKVKSRRMTNDQIRAISSKLFNENTQVLEYLRTRNDLIGVHGLWHTHQPTSSEIELAKFTLQGLGLSPTYFIPPFNEGDYAEEISGLRTSILSADKGERLEDFLDNGYPTAEMMYLHSWRFDNSWYTFDQLERALKRIDQPEIKLNLGSKYRKLPGFDNLDKLFGWYFQDGLSHYKDSSVDGITISHALMFLDFPELETFMKEMWRVLKPGGVVRITEDDTENPQGNWYKTGNTKSGPRCLTGPHMMRRWLKLANFKVFDVDRLTTHFYDQSLKQAYRGGPPHVFFIEGMK